MREKLWDERFGGWPRMVLRDGSALDPEKRAFTEAYAIIGLAEYHAATGGAHVLALAKIAYDSARDYLYDGLRGGYYLSAGRDWSILSTRKTICSQLDMLFAQLSMYRQTSERRYLHDAIQLANLMLEHMYDRRFHCLVETCNENWSYNPFATRDVTWIGHNLKGAWVLLQLFEITRQAHFREAAHAILDFSIRFGYDAANGGFFHYVYRSGPLASQEKLWWTNCEALMALLLAVRLGDGSKYLPYFNGTLDFCMNSFYDPQHGEWYRSCDAGGTPWNSTKGGGDKGAYHTVQACAFAYECLLAIERTELPA
jgi:mannose/cellobiose epimerase-like protein (N-acyl-D-glucosamine 2-epimerase family)